MMSPNRIREVLHELLDNGIAGIPVYKTRNGNGFTGKVTRIKNWQLFSDDLPTTEIIDSWPLKDASGVAVVLGPASNLACVDIDRDDALALSKMQWSSCRVVGQKGEKRFFRQRYNNDEPVPHGTVITHNKLEFFLRQKYAVIDGLHSQGDNSDPIEYKQLGDLLTELDFDGLPVIDMAKVEVAKGLTTDDKPIAPQESAAPDGRFNDMASKAGYLASRNTPFEEAVQELLDHDDERNKFNLFFLDKKWHKGASKRINAMVYYSNHLQSFAQNKLPAQIEEPKSIIISKLVEGQAWEKPRSIQFKNIIPEMELSMVPEVMKPWISWQQENLGVDLAPVYNKAETALSALIGNKIVIQPKEHDYAWKEAANLWTMFIAAPGRKKSPISKSVLGPLRKIENDIVEQSERDAIEILEKKTILAMQIKNKEQFLKTALRENLTNEIKDAQAELKELNREDSLLRPLDPQILVGSVTMQKLGQISVANPSGVLMEVDELGQLWANMSKENSGLFRGFLLQGWGGLSSYRHQTVGSTKFHIPHLCISLMANVQPSLFNSMVHEQITKNSDDGFLQRSIICFDSEKLYKHKDIEIKGKHLEAIQNLFWRAYNVEPGLVTFSKKARAYLYEYQEYLDDLIVREPIPMLGGFLSKFRGLLIKRAYIFNFINSKFANSEIPLEAVKTASRHLDLNYKNIKTALLSPSFEMAQSFIGELKSCTIENGISYSDLKKSHRRYFENRFLQDTMFDLLHEYNYVKTQKVGKSKKLLINPLLFPE